MAVLEAERPAAVERERVEQRLGEAVVVVAGDERSPRARRAPRRAPRRTGGRASSATPSGRSRSSTTSPSRTTRSAPAISSSRARADRRRRAARPRRWPAPRWRSETIAVRIPLFYSTGSWPALGSTSASDLAEQPAGRSRMHCFGEERMAPANGIELCLPGDGRPRRRAAAPGDGPGDADDRLGRGLLRAAGRARLPRRPLRQPRHRPLDQDRVRRRAEPGRHDRRPPRHRALPAARHGRRHDRADGPPRDRLRPRRRRLDGRDDRPDRWRSSIPSGSARWSRSCRPPAAAGSACRACKAFGVLLGAPAQGPRGGDRAGGQDLHA